MADGQELYDEFGNYVGPELDDSSDEEDSSDDGGGAPDDASAISDDDLSRDGGGRADLVAHGGGEGEDELGAAPGARAIVLHEDKVHYPSAGEVYGEGVRTAVLDEDAMDLEEPIVEPIRRSTFSLMRDENESEDREAYGDGTVKSPGEAAEDLVSDRFVAALAANETTRTRRCLALVGHLHCGKTGLVDLLVEQTKAAPARGFGPFGPKAAMEAHRGGGPRVTDTLQSEQDRQLSIKSAPITLCLPDTRGKTYALTVIDCPGHTNFHDESVASLRVADGAAVVLDAVEGVMLHTEMLLRQVIQEGLPIVLVINKIDRLVLELKLPPEDMYHKLRQLVDSVNAYVSHQSNGRYPKLSPDRGNVVFASSMHGYAFTLASFANQLLDHLDFDNEDGTYEEDGDGDAFGAFRNACALGSNLGPDELAKRLWGNSFLDPRTRTFRRRGGDCSPDPATGAPPRRTFVRYVLEPLYKMYTLCVGEGEADVERSFRGLGVLLSKEQLRSSARPLMRAAFRRYFGPSTGFVDAAVGHIPSPAAAARGKVARCYSGPLTSRAVKAMVACDSSGPLVIHVAKLYAESDGQSFSAFGRIYSGTVRPGDRVKVLGEAYTPDDDEDMAFATVSSVWIPRGRSRTEVMMARAGNWVLLGGVDADIVKTATIVAAGKSNFGGDDGDGEIHVFRPLRFPQAGGESTMKLAVEPLNPAELPKMVEGLRRVSKSYPMATTRVEESGEHILFGTGELYLDCAMHDLRQVYSDIEVKVADPVVGFRETVVETSSVKCFSEVSWAICLAFG